jgi:predicted Zn finger-like uncharacterized protein
MPEVVSCPDCQSKLRVPDNLLGKKVKCPKCSNAFTARLDQPDVEEQPRQPAVKARKAAPPPRDEEEEEAPRSRKPARREEEFEDEPASRRRRSAPPRDEEEDEAPRSRRRREEDEDEEPRGRRRRDEEDEDYEVGSIRKQQHGTVADWLKLRNGFTFLIGGQVVLGVALVIGLLLCGIMWASFTSEINAAALRPGGATGAGMQTGIVALIAMLILPYATMFLWGGLSITGHIFTIFSPPKHGAKVLAIIALCLAGWNFLTLIGAFALDSAALFGLVYGRGMVGRSGGGGFLIMPAFITWPAYMIVFLFCIRSLAQAMKNEALAKNSVFLMIMVGVSWVVTCLMPCIMIIGAMGATNAALQSNNPNAAVGAAQGVGIVFMVCLVVVGLLWLGSYVWYLIHLCQVRGSINQHLSGR